jgi:cell wall-associated NlpC family hydrolase
MTRYVVRMTTALLAVPLLATAPGHAAPARPSSSVVTAPQITQSSSTVTRYVRTSSANVRYVSGYVLTSSAPASGSLSGTAIINEAKKYVGIMYRAGGSTPAGFDCSGYTQYVFGQLGEDLPRTVSGQRTATTRVSSPRVGDLVFWGTGHLAIYAGNGYIYDSGKPGLPVQKRKMFSGVTGYARVG